jgi:hypothetical protein
MSLKGSWRYDRGMNLLSLILIAMAVFAAICIFYVAWQFSSGRFEPGTRNDPENSRQTDEPPGD